MPRHYDYIEQITPYKTDDELLKHIKTSEGKWIIFVHSEKNGKELEKELIKSQIVSKDDCILISRPEIELESKEMTEYDYIINNEMSSKRILISTCVLDNGINIKNPIDESKKQTVGNYCGIFGNHIESFSSKMDNIDKVSIFWYGKTGRNV